MFITLKHNNRLHTTYSCKLNVSLKMIIWFKHDKNSILHSGHVVSIHLVILWWYKIKRTILFNGTACSRNSGHCSKNKWQHCTACVLTGHALWGPDVQFNLLKPNDIYICRTAALTSRRYILNIDSTNIHTEYFKHAA